MSRPPIDLIRLNHTHIELLRQLRNANAEAFFDSHIIDARAQEAWFCRYLTQTRHQMFTIRRCQQLLGFIGTTHLFDTPAIPGVGSFAVREVGNLLLPERFRGQGIMTDALTELRRLFDPLTFWIAHVKPSNAASFRLFKRAGFWNLNGDSQ